MRCRCCDTLLNYDYYVPLDRDDGFCNTCRIASQDDSDIKEYQFEGAFTGVTPSRSNDGFGEGRG